MDRTQLNKATAENPSPPPGYIYTEISKWTHNNPSVNQSLEKYLISRLKKNNPFVKWKVLLIIKHTSPKANVGFKRCMQRHTDVIKACMQYRGPPHATLGDTPYENVRTEAKAAVAAVFAESTKAQTHGLQSKITSMGSSGSGGSSGGQQQQQQHAAFSSQNAGRYQTSTAGSGGGGGGGGGRYGGASGGGGGGGGASDGRTGGAEQMGALGSAGSGSYRGAQGRAMVGQGNPNFKDPRNQKPGMMNKIGGMFKGKKKDEKPNFMNTPTGAQGYNYASNRGPNAVGTSGYGAPVDVPASSTGTGYASTNSPARRLSGNRKVGGVGGGWGSSDGDDVQLRKGGGSGSGSGSSGSGSSGSGSSGNGNRNGSGGSNSTSNSNQGSAGRIGTAGSAKSDGAYETQLVDNICTPGGLRPTPTSSDVTKFVARCKTLAAETMASLLVDRVVSEDWTVSAKALVVVEELCRDSACAEFADYFYDHKDIFEEEMKESEQKLVRDRSKKILVTLGVEGLVVDGGGSGGRGRRNKGRAALPDIPNVDDVLGGGGGGGMMDFDGADATTAAAAAATVVAPTASSDQDDLLGMFGGMSSTPAAAVAPVSAAAAPVSAAAAAAAAAPAANGGLMGGMFDGLGSTSVAPTSAATTPASGGFDFMSAPAASSAPPAVAGPASGGSLLLPTSSAMPAPMAPMTPMAPMGSTTSMPAANVRVNIPITSAFDGLDMNKGSSPAMSSSNFAFQQQAQQRQQQQQQRQPASSGNDPLASLSGIAPSKSTQGGLLGMDFSNSAATQANQQQKMQQIFAAQQRQQRQQQQGGGMSGMSGMSGMGGMGGMGGMQQQTPSMSMAGMGGVRAMQPGGNQPLPNFNQGQQQQQQAQQPTKASASFGFVNDMLGSK